MQNRVRIKKITRRSPLFNAARLERSEGQFFPTFLWFSVWICAFLVFFWAGYGLLVKSSIFRLARVEMTGNTLITQEEVMEFSGLELGMVLLGMSCAKVEKNIAGHPWIDTASVQIHWPSVLQVRIREQKPFALINLEGEGGRRLYYINSKGVIFAPATGQYDMDFPTMTGTGTLLVEEIQGNRFIPGSLAAEVFGLLRYAASKESLPVQVISEVHVSTHGMRSTDNLSPASKKALTMYLVDQPFPIKFSLQTKGKQTASALRKALRRQYRDLLSLHANLNPKNKLDTVRDIQLGYSTNKVLISRKDTDG